MKIDHKNVKFSLEHFQKGDMIHTRDENNNTENRKLSTPQQNQRPQSSTYVNSSYLQKVQTDTENNTDAVIYPGTKGTVILT